MAAEGKAKVGHCRAWRWAAARASASPRSHTACGGTCSMFARAHSSTRSSRRSRSAGSFCSTLCDTSSRSSRHNCTKKQSLKVGGAYKALRGAIGCVQIPVQSGRRGVQSGIRGVQRTSRGAQSRVRVQTTADGCMRHASLTALVQSDWGSLPRGADLPGSGCSAASRGSCARDRGGA
jgi:hypothetical protein